LTTAGESFRVGTAALSEPWRILLVDDDLRVHELVRWTLRAPRFDVHAFADPRQALAGVGKVRPHLIICDMMMPMMDGQVFLRLVKQTPDLKRIPFLFLTAVRLGSEVQAALDAGAVAYLVKPFPLAKLAETVKQILAAASAKLFDETKATDSSAAPESEDQEATPRHDWPETNAADVLEMVTGSAPSVQPPQPPSASMGSAAASLPASRVPRVPMESNGATVLSDTPLSVPERPAGDVGEASESEAAPESGPATPPPVFEGRFSIVEHGGARIQVVTEAESRPNFVITTNVSADGRGLRKIESFWGHPLRRPKDRELVRKQIDLQHDRATADVRVEPLFGPRRQKLWRNRAASAPRKSSKPPES